MEKISIKEPFSNVIEFLLNTDYDILTEVLDKGNKEFIEVEFKVNGVDIPFEKIVDELYGLLTKNLEKAVAKEIESQDREKIYKVHKTLDEVAETLQDLNRENRVYYED